MDLFSPTIHPRRLRGESCAAHDSRREGEEPCRHSQGIAQDPWQEWRVRGQRGASAAGTSLACGVSSGVWTLRAALCCGRWVDGLEEHPLWSSKAGNHP